MASSEDDDTDFRQYGDHDMVAECDPSQMIVSRNVEHDFVSTHESRLSVRDELSESGVSKLPV
jgi:hypothetical protein